LRLVSQIKHRLPVWSWWIVTLCVTGVAWPQTQGQQVTGRTSWWLPENVFEPGNQIDLLFNIILWMTGIVCVVVFVVMAVFLIRYRHRPDRRAAFIHGNTPLEVVWTLIPALIMVLTAAFSQSTWSNIKTQPVDNPDNPAIRMAVIGRQFNWYFHYPGADGRFGPRDTQRVNLKSADPDEHIGLDRTHPDAKDDIVAVKMYIPVNKKVLIDLTSVDVIHSFFLPNFRIKQDAVPGLGGRVWIESTKTSAQVIGTEADGSPKPFDIVCAELCGQGHYKMRGQLFVVSQAEYEQFLETEASYLDFGEDEDDYGY